MKLLRHVPVILALAALAACDRPKVISDSELKEITKEIFISNAYANRRHLDVDSLDIYETVFERHGYTIEDFRYTLLNFSKRKSSRFSHIIKDVFDELNVEYEFYRRKAAILDTIDVIAGERFKHIVHRDSLIRVTKLADTSRLRISFPVTEGRYEISYRVFVDSLDKNTGHRSTIVSIDTAGVRNTVNTQWISRESWQKKSYTFNSSPRYDSLQLILGGVFTNKPAKRPHITIDSLLVVRYLPREQALDSMNKVLLNYRLMVDSVEYDRVFALPDSLAAKPPMIIVKED